MTSDDINTDLSEKNIEVLFEFYLTSYRTLFRFALRHQGAETGEGVLGIPLHQVVENPEPHQSVCYT